MHELAVCQALLRQVEAVAAEKQARGVEAVRVRIGPLAGVEVAILEEAYLVPREGTCAAGSRLIVEHAPLEVSCTACGARSAAEPARLRCPRCGSPDARLLRGDELLLVSVNLVF
jgi:hydrogenase nickel incorporation protein HypA/HybF